jgi:hypothetical protein
MMPTSPAQHGRDFHPEDLTTQGSEDKTTMIDDTSKEEFSARESIAVAGPSSINKQWVSPTILGSPDT